MLILDILIEKLLILKSILMLENMSLLYLLFGMLIGLISISLCMEPSLLLLKRCTISSTLQLFQEVFNRRVWNMDPRHPNQESKRLFIYINNLVSFLCLSITLEEDKQDTLKILEGLRSRIYIFWALNKKDKHSIVSLELICRLTKLRPSKISNGG